MKKNLFILVILLVVSALLLSGCTETTICGDSICSPGEENTCVTDCASPVDATVNINVSGAWDAEGDLSLYWYHSKDVYANASANITSRLGDNWFGEQSKNLYISFNESESGSQPLGTDRSVSMDFSKPGDYYFEARSEDYAYRAVSDKITISESGEYYVSLSMTPSNPAVRVKAIDEYGNQLYGDGKIDLYAIETVCEYGECREDKWLYDSRTFYAKDEMNVLFFVYVPQGEFSNKRSINYEAVISKPEYITMNSWIGIWSKYQETQVIMQKEASNEVGDLKVSIVPGLGTTQEDLLELEGANISVCGHYASCKGATVQNGTIYVPDLAYDTYYVYRNYADYDYQSSNPPMSLEELKVDVDSEVVYADAKGLRGFGIKISLLDGSGNLIDTVNEEIYSRQSCMGNGNIESCSEVSDPPQQLYIPSNPAEMSSPAYSEQQIIDSSDDYVRMELLYNGNAKWFTYTMKQGYQEFVWQFDDVELELFDENVEIQSIKAMTRQSSVFDLSSPEYWVSYVIDGTPMGQYLLPGDSIIAGVNGEKDLRIENFYDRGIDTNGCSTQAYLGEFTVSKETNSGVTGVELIETPPFSVNSKVLGNFYLEQEVEVESVGFNVIQNKYVAVIRLDGNGVGFEIEIGDSIELQDVNGIATLTFVDVKIPSCSRAVSAIFASGLPGNWTAYIWASSDLRADFLTQEDWMRINVGETFSIAGAANYDGKKLTVELVDLVVMGGGSSSNYQAKWALKDGTTVLKYVQSGGVAYDLANEFGSEYTQDSTIVHGAGALVDGSSYFALIEE